MANSNTNLFEEVDIDNFLKNNSFSGLLALYVFNLSFVSRKGFSLESIERKIDFLPNKYSLAFLVFSKAVGITDYTTNSNSEEIFYNITSYNEVLSLRIRDAVYSKANSTDELIKKDKSKSNGKSWKSKVEDAEAYFLN